MLRFINTSANTYKMFFHLANTEKHKNMTRCAKQIRQNTRGLRNNKKSHTHITLKKKK